MPSRLTRSVRASHLTRRRSPAHYRFRRRRRRGGRVRGVRCDRRCRFRGSPAIRDCHFADSRGHCAQMSPESIQWHVINVHRTVVNLGLDWKRFLCNKMHSQKWYLTKAMGIRCKRLFSEIKADNPNRDYSSVRIRIPSQNIDVIGCHEHST